jgi:hypothetical protein
VIVSPWSAGGLTFHLLSGLAFGRVISPSISWLLNLGSLGLNLLRAIVAYFLLT